MLCHAHSLLAILNKYEYSCSVYYVLMKIPSNVTLRCISIHQQLILEKKKITQHKLRGENTYGFVCTFIMLFHT